MAVGFATAAAVKVTRRVELPDARVRVLGRLAIGVAVAMVPIFGGIVTWWASEAAHAQRVLLHGIGNGLPFSSGVAPPSLVIAALLMMLGLALAAAGSCRVARSLRAGGGAD